MTRQLRVAVVGAGPAGIYASDLLLKSDVDCHVDLLEKMPTPFGLIRYGVAPDHPRIKGIVTSLTNVLNKPNLRFLGNIDVGATVTVDELSQYYDAVIFATGAVGDRELGIPGADLPETHGAGEFVGFYDGNPLFQRDWDLSAPSVAVIGVGNVALDISRVLAKTADELHTTEIPDNVYRNLSASAASTVHIFGRRGPAQAKFTPLELKELDYSENVTVVVSPEDIDYDEASFTARRSSKAVDLVCQTLESYALREPGEANTHTIHIHFFEEPAEILADEDGHVKALRTERTKLNGDGTVSGTGEFTTWDVQSVYHAIGYRSDPVPGLPFDAQTAVIPNDGGHVIDQTGNPLPGLYATGWIKRGPIGLIGNTKSDAKETTTMLLEDWKDGTLTPSEHGEDDFLHLVEGRGHQVTTWEGWHKIDATERAHGEAEGRERKKLVEWEDMLHHAEHGPAEG